MTRKWRILLLDTKKSNPNHYICLAIKQAFEDHPFTESITKAYYGNAIERAIENNCNLFIAFDGEELNKSICARIASICDVSVLWVTEDPYESSINQVNANYFDLVFTNDSGSVGKYGSKGRHLPFAASPKLHFHKIVSEQNNHYRYDLFFAGTAWPNRVEFIKNIHSNLKDIKQKLALPYNAHIPVPDLGSDQSRYLWKMPNSEFARFANKSRSVLTLHRSFSSSGGSPTALTPGPRLFEVALAGGFQLIDMSLPEVEKYFEEDSQFVGFHSSDECIEKLRYYLSNPDKRIAIAKSAQNRALKEHLYSNRIETIYSEISDLEKSNIKYNIPKSRPNVLFVAHNVIGVQPYGGVEVYQHTIIEKLKKYYRFFVYTVDRSVSPIGNRYVLYDENMNVTEIYNFKAEISDATLSCADRERTFSKILLKNNIKLVHYHHFIGHIPSLPYISKALGIPSIASLNDYYAVCKYFNLMGYRDRFCNVSMLPQVGCDICLNAKDNMSIGSQAVRRAFFGRTLEQVNVLHANTNGVAALFEDVFPNFRYNKKFRVKGLPLPIKSNFKRNTVNLQNGTINIAVVGNFTRIKGADVIIHAINQMRNDKVLFHVFGTVTEPYNTIFDQLELPNVIIHGEFEAGSIVDELKNMVLSLHLSIWPETYCITLSEAWQAGLVPIVSDIGALGERVTHGVNGFKVPMEEPGPVVNIIRKLVAQPELIESVRTKISSNDYVACEEHAMWLNDLYNKLIDKFDKVNASISNTKQLTTLSLSDCGVILNKKTWPIYANSKQVQIHDIASSSVVRYMSLFHKVNRYMNNYGAKATFERVMHELKIRINNTIRKKLL